MATFSPFGLQPVKYLNGAAWNGQTNPYFIESGYANNIFRGDPVIIGSNGFITSLANFADAPAEWQDSDVGHTWILGTFWGCSYVNQNGVNPIDPASPGRMMWAANTQTLGGQPAIAEIMDDPNVICLVQTNSPVGVTQAQMFLEAGVAFSYVSSTPPLVDGNFTTGQSKAYIDVVTSPTPTPNTFNLRMRSIPPTNNNAASVPYNTVEVLLQKTCYGYRGT